MDESIISIFWRIFSISENRGLRFNFKNINDSYQVAYIIFRLPFKGLVFSKYIPSCESVWQDRMLICKEFGTWKRNANMAGVEKQLSYCFFFFFFFIHKMLGSKTIHCLLVNMCPASRNTVHNLFSIRYVEQLANRRRIPLWKRSWLLFFHWWDCAKLCNIASIAEKWVVITVSGRLHFSLLFLWCFKSRGLVSRENYLDGWPSFTRIYSITPEASVKR